MKPPKPKTKTAKKTTGRPASLRKRAEKLLAKQKERLRKLSSANLKKLVHELGTHQLELEMQNEELRRAQSELEASRNRYVELYDLSPVGYFTIDAQGLIRETNLTGAEMLGVARRMLLDKPFSLFVDREYLAVYQAHRKDVFRRQTRQSCELRLRPRNAPTVHARLQSAAVENTDDKAGLMRTSVIDITGLKRLEEEREQLINDLRTAAAKIKTLSGLLPICATCKKIRDDKGYWQQLEQYITENSEATFTHGMCPDCFATAMQDIEKRRRDRKAGG